MKHFTTKLSILVALILCVTIGGVYATWTYAASAGVSETVNKGVSLTPVTQSGSLGVYEVLSAELTLAIDQAGPGDYTPVLKFSVASDDGSLDFVFKPAAVASDDIKENGIASTVSFSSTLQHNGQDLFSFPVGFEIGTIGSGEAYEWVKQADGTFHCTIPNADLANYIQFIYAEKLDTYAKYQAFEASLTGGNVIINIANHPSVTP